MHAFDKVLIYLFLISCRSLLLSVPWRCSFYYTRCPVLLLSYVLIGLPNTFYPISSCITHTFLLVSSPFSLSLPGSFYIATEIFF
ncbi:hypothetical protein B0J11DRAFT_538177 [Dendryphion nanum]|uniref:Uncharacterized protein n=1 Tax=Dendryphion nanum TaxID=256645 RepID=A0A9P9DDJ3_9PLEO|nr:hypothetical protein B0J11DRAFT_538177 [Dendryphion nanum]